MQAQHEKDVREALALCPDSCGEGCKCSVWRCSDVAALLAELDDLRRHFAESVRNEE